MRATFLVAFAALLAVSAAQAQSLVSIPSSVSVDDANIRAILKDNATVVSIPIENTNDHAIRADLSLAWLSPDETTGDSARQTVSIPIGKTSLQVPFPIETSSIWTRLRYTLTPVTADARAFAPIRGILSLPHIADYVFEVKIGHVGFMHLGDPISVFAEAVHPLTRVPAAGVEWTGTLEVGNRTLTPKDMIRHGGGIVEFVFDAPTFDKASGEDPDDSVKAEISAKLGDFEVVTDDSIQLQTRWSARLQSDKPIYQPGQTLHLRAVVLDPQGRAIPAAKVSLHISTEDRERLHTVQLVASKFGVVQDDWTIPDNTDLGALQIELVSQDDDDSRIARHVVRLSRYELPTFSVTATPDRPAYLPTQQPHVTISGMYLFGKPVPNGHVKIVRSADTYGSFRGSKPDSNDKVVAEGDADSKRYFSAELDLKADHEDLKNSERQLFKDVHFAAYFKDPSTGRTEQRKFDLRVTREAIHIYTIRTNLDSELGETVYISTSSAAGGPVATAVNIVFRGKRVSLETNQYGIGKVVLPSSLDDEDDDDSEGPEIWATDSAGQTGHKKERYWGAGYKLLAMETGHTLYRTGESVTLRLTSAPGDAADQEILIHALADDRRIVTRVVQMTNHKAEITFPYQPEFQNTMVFTAWNAADPRANFQAKMLGARAVIFPGQSDLKVTALTERTTYKPGEKVPLRIQVASSNGSPVEAALGLAVVDQAVLERARTDAEFGHRSWFSCAFCSNAGETGFGDVRLNDLYALKPTDAITPDLDLVAEAMVATETAFMSGADSESLLEAPKFQAILSQTQQITSVLDRHYGLTLEFPKNLADWNRILASTWTNAVDPWGERYSADFNISRVDRVVTLRSSGPDKKRGTDDDFVAATFRRSYVAPIRVLLEDLLDKQEDYPANSAEFNRLLQNNGFRMGTLRDAWDTPYRVKVETNGINRVVTLDSAGPDRQFETRDDFQALRFSGGYFRHEGKAITLALQKANEPPQDSDAFRAVMAQAGVDITRVRDDWNRPYRVINTISSRYSDRINPTTARIFGAPARQVSDVVPVTQRFITFLVRSAGPDGVEGTYDDFDIARFSVLLSEESAAPGSARKSSAIPRGTGVIAGDVVDPTGAIISGVNVALTDPSGMTYETVTDELGHFSFTSLAPGTYSMQSVAAGFKTYRLTQVPVVDGKITDVDIELGIGQTADSVTVTAEAALLQTSSASVVSSGPTATPRVREYFPETLLWIPELVTDASGKARASIPLADSVTTWKIAVIASTLDGRIAEAESDLRAFQPFFVDFDAPPILTKGDQVEVPVTVRNYEKTAKKVAVTLEANKWSALKKGSLARQISVPPNGSANTSYVIQATSATENAEQRFSAIAGRSRDAIARSSRVHPDGQEIVQNVGDLVVGNTAFTVTIPQASIPDATRGELRLYPNIASLLLESASAILITPHGCAEQTISAGYANLVAWRFARTAGIVDPMVEQKAAKNIRLALDGLLSFTGYAGGVSYWSSGDADVAVTAHALSFLVEARQLMPVDSERMQAMITWLETHQGKDGRWVPDGSFARLERKLADRQALLLTGIVSKALAAAKHAGMKVSSTALAGAYHHLAQFTDQTDEPYLLATFILAALDSGDASLLGNAATRLLSLSRAERDGLYWDLQSNSPFYGWGTAGRYETTGLVVSALAAWKAQHPSPEAESQIRRGLLFLLRGRDATGGWSSSTQSTLRAMAAIADASQSTGNFGGAGGTMEIRSNGRLVKTIALPRDPNATDAILVDLSASLLPGENQIVLTPSGGSQSVMMHFSSTHWVPWETTSVRSSPELRLAVQFERLEARAGEPVRCSVKAERVGFRGYGMMLAEIGLPPGAEVDRASLESALDDPALGVDHYEVLPDRVLLYLWPKAGGSNFDFMISARLPMIAKTAASVLYDYYNPEAMSEVAPSRWVVR